MILSISSPPNHLSHSHRTFLSLSSMASSLPSFRNPIVYSAAKPPPSAAAQSRNWWAPIFGWSSEPDYITAGGKIEAVPGIESGRIAPEKVLFRGCFTEEKAKEMRKKTIETSTFHDIMYHSAIASRLASDVSPR